MIRTKYVKSAIEPRKDGLRILAARLRGRGLPANRYDVWMPNLGPSEDLLHAYQEKKITRGEFRRRYRAELYEGGTIDERNETIKNHGQKFTLRLLQKLAEQGNLTLMCHCKENAKDCHRHLLAALLRTNI